MKKQMHLAAQYLAAAGISFLEKKEDDSHTNLGFNVKAAALETHILSKNEDQLALNYRDFSLVWKSKTNSATFNLDKKSHQEVLAWLTETSKRFLNKTYAYSFHYSLPYEIDESFIFELKNSSELNELIQLRTLAETSLDKINKQFQLNSNPRVWPHHFDTGIYGKLSNTEIFVGLGLAIPDNVCKEHYFYTSGYKENTPIKTSNFQSLKIGAWKNEDFKGAVLPKSKAAVMDVIDFFKETIKQYKNYN